MRIVRPVLFLFASAAVVTGAFALSEPAPDSNWYNPHCGSPRRFCHYEEGYTCPPCFELQRCAPCACVPLKGCVP
jgi:hypothetical protein